MPRYQFMPWEHYPRRITGMLEHFRLHGRDTPLFISTPSGKDAQVLRNRIYKWFNAIMVAEKQAEETKMPRQDMVACGLHAAIQVQRNVVVAAMRQAPWGVSIRWPVWGDPPRFITVEEAIKQEEFLSGARVVLGERQHEQEDKFYEEMLAAVICPITELQCSNNCQAKCERSGEVLKKA